MTKGAKKQKNKFCSNLKFGIGNLKLSRGFTIIELVVTIFIFAILLSGVIGCFSAITRVAKVGREKTILSSLSSDYLEIVRNMPYSQVGTINGSPHGNLPDATSPVNQTIGAIGYQIYYEVTFIDDPADGTALAGTDLYAADYKQVKMDIKNLSTGQVTSFFTNVVPQGLEGTNNQGALRISVIDSGGNPVSGANIHITYPTTTPTLVLDRSTDSNGQWVEVGLTPAINNYHIVVTKNGYSQDQTYSITATNPNPSHPDATVANGSITAITFSIDLLANLNIKTLNSTCQAINGVNLNVKGAKLVGAATSSPPSSGLYKFNNNYSSAAGAINLTNIEWDTYTPTLLSGQSVVVYGTSPIQKIDVLPNTTQTFSMILGSNSTANSLLVVIKDSSSSTALENAFITLSQGGSTVASGYTGGSVWVQNDWSGGGGLSQWSTTTPNQYFQSDGNVDTTSGVKLKKVSGNYVASGWVESSTFDTGTGATNYTILSWQPSSQSASTTLQFQVAANNDNATWNYVGPDGTSATYFTTPGTDMGSALDGNRYVRYKAYLSTQKSSITPILSSLNLNFVTGCFTPGQVIFTGLSATNYTVTVSLSGYQTQANLPVSVNGNQSFQVLMSP